MFALTCGPGREFGLADVSIAQDVQAFGISGHQAVFDTVVNHLHKVAGAMRATVQKAFFSGAGASRAAGCGRGRRSTWGQRREDWPQLLELRRLAADHQAVTTVETGHAAAGADIEMMDAQRLQFGCASNVVAIVRIAAIYDGVTGLQQRCQVGQQRVDPTGRHHQPDHPRPAQVRNHLLQGCGACGTCLQQTLDGSLLPVVDHTGMASDQEAPNHAVAHAAQPDHA